VLYVGSLLNRRHVPALVRAFRTVADRLPDARLAIVGENRTFPFEDPERVARELGIAGRVDMRAYVPDAELAGLYARAAAFAFLSTYEGFGLTPVEAMAAGVPVVTADTPVAREIYGNAAIYVDPGDTAAVAAALVRVMLDEGERARLLEAGAAVVGGMSWTETARATLDAIEAAGRS
jgi:glycosyltransferase involved in cell wall biosynthesis